MSRQHLNFAPGRERVAVSLTPLALEADSRALKVAMSLRRFGYRSIVIEGVRSMIDFAQYRLEVRSLGGPVAQADEQRSVFARQKGKKGPLAHLLRFTWFWMQFSWKYGVVPLFRVPRADVYYVHSYEYLPVPLVTGRKARVIYDAHDFYRDMYPQEMLSELVSRYLRPSLARLETAMARRCDAVVTVSHGVAKAIEEAMSVRPHVIPNAFDRRMNTQTSCDIRARIGLAPDRILLVIAGNNKSETRFDYITALLTGLPTHVHIAFVGRGYEASDENMRQSDMRDRLHFIPAVSPFEITSFIASADAGLLLYRPISITFKNSLPNRFFHFLDAGLPIVRFALPEVERVIGDAPVGPILDPRNPIQSAKTLAAFLADVDARRAAAAAAKALGETITWAAQEHALRTIIEPQASASS